MLVYSLPGTNETLIFSDEVLKVFNESRQDAAHKRETGGQLFANIGEKTVNVVLATLPTPNDIQSRYGFVRDQVLEQRAIVKHKGRGLDYIGDWHTHPQMFPYPSGVDKRTTAKLFRQSKHNLTGFLMIIIGIDPRPQGIYVGVRTRWRLSSLRSQHIHQLPSEPATL